MQQQRSTPSNTMTNQPHSRRTGLIQLVLVVVFIVGAVLLSFLLKSTYTTPQERITTERVFVVQAQNISPVDHRVSFQATGIIEARNTVNIVPEVSGRVVSVYPDFFPGGSFTRNDVLFTLEPRDFELEVRRQKAEVTRAKTALDIETAESAAALSEWRQRHGDKQAPSLVARAPQLDEAKANLVSANASLENAQLNLARSQFILPFDGRVLSSDISPGQYITAGQSFGQVFDRTALEITASLTDQQLQWLLSTDTPDITISAHYLGEVKRYAGVLKRGVSSLNADTRFASVRFGFSEQVDTLLPGIFSQIEVLGPEIENVMILPVSALQANNVVWILDADRLTRWQPNIIYIDENRLIVEGLNRHITVVTNSVPGGIEGMRVQVAQIGTKDDA
ncbi:MAG: efflux RND transporter periplasmic adaptor subunit [Pseudomonadota bacterium]